MPIFKTQIAGRFLLTPKSLGFTLIEIIVAIGIIAVISAVAIPNFRSFSRNQDIVGTASNISNALKRAQSSANSRIRCPVGERADTWIVRLTPNNFSLISKCLTQGERVIYQSPYSPSLTDATSMFSMSTNVCVNQAIDVIFTPNSYVYQCSGSSSQFSGEVRILIRNSDNTLTQTIKVDLGGVIKVE